MIPTGDRKDAPALARVSAGPRLANVIRHGAGKLNRADLQGAGWMLYAYGGGFLAQGVYFLILARTLGAGGLGIFVGSLGVVSIAAPFAGLGTGNLLLMAVSRDPQTYAGQLGLAVRWICVSSAAFGLAIGLVHSTLLHNSPLAALLLPLFLSEAFAARFVELAAFGFQAHGRTRESANITISLGIIRLGAVSIFSGANGSSPLSWSWCYCGCTFAVAATVLLVATLRLGKPKSNLGWAPGALAKSLPFSIGQASKTVYTDVDKALLASLASPMVAGAYAAAYRFVSFAFTPVQAVVVSNGPKFFRLGLSGPRTVSKTVSLLVRPILAYAVAATLVLELASPFLSLVLGPGFAASGRNMRLLAPLLVVQATHYLFGDAIMGLGRQRLRAILQVMTAAINAVLCVILIPHFGVFGAAVATLIGEGLLAAASVVILRTMAGQKSAQVQR